jgi:serine/threonine-protein kinase RsbW
VNIRQALVLDAQFDATRRIGLDDVDELPGNGARAESARNRLQPGPRQNSLEHAAECAAQTHLYLSHTQQVSRPLAHPFQVDVVYADHLAAMNIDDLAIDEILLEENMIAVAAKGRNDRVGAELKRAGRRLQHVLRRNQAQAVAGFQYQPDNSAGLGARGHGNIFELAAQLALRIGHGSTEQCGETHASCCNRLHRLSVALFEVVTETSLDTMRLRLETSSRLLGQGGAGKPAPAEAKDSPVTESTQGKRSFRLSSTMESVGEVEEAAEQLAIDAGFDGDERFRITMAVHEAAINAVLHGNDYNPALHVDISMENTGRALVFVIADQGKGFDPESLPDPSLPENILRGTGRGIFLIRSLMDEVHFRPLHPGTELTMIKYLASQTEKS